MPRRTKLDSDAKVEAKIKQIEDIFILSPRHEEILDKIDKCRTRSKLSKEPRCMLIMGRQGVGKTTTYEHYEQRWPREETPEGTRVPVLSVQIDAPATVKSLVTEMLAALGEPAAEKGTVVSQTQRLRKLLKDCGVELIILDEFQHFIDSDSKKVLKTISDWLKVLINKTKTPIVLCGMPYSKQVLDARGNEQLRDRFSSRIYIEPFGWGPSPDDQKSFRVFLAKVDEELPLAPSDLGSKTMAFRLYCASNGFPRHVMNLVRDAAIMAVDAGKKKVDLDLLAEAYHERYADEYPERKNPFSADEDELEIVPFEESEPELKNLQEVLSRETASDVLRKR